MNIESRLVVARMEQKVGVSRYKLLYTVWVNNKVLIYSTKNYVQCPMRNHNGKECLKRMYIQQSHYFKAEINTTL